MITDRQTNAVGGAPLMWNGETFARSGESRNYTIALVLPVVNHQGIVLRLIKSLKIKFLLFLF
jgi:hypothetical protein